MPLSNWRLIRTQDEVGAEAAAAAAPGPAAAVSESTSNGRDILRGRSRAVSRSTAATAASSYAASGTGAGGPETAAAEVRRAEQAAQERGYQVGIARAEAELRASVEASGAFLDRLHAAAPERTSEIAHAIAELALSVAKRIVQHEVRLDPSLLCGALESAVSTINGSPEAHVLLNPAAVEPVSQAWEALHGRAYLGKTWIFEGDPTLPVGGCTLRYEHGFVEAGLEAQLEEIGIALDRAIPSLARGTVEEEVA